MILVIPAALRCFPRWIATLLTLTVAANFAAMPWRPPPTWITFAPLPPLLLLLGTGLVMLVAPSLAGAHRAVLGSRR